MHRSRGQIILVSAFALAVIFVSLALVLNTAIYTENLATRETVDDQDAVDLRTTAKATGDRLLRATNDNASFGGYTDRVAAYEDAIAAYSAAENDHSITRGALRSVAVRETREGTAIRQSTDTSYPVGPFTVAAGVSDTRRARFNVTSGSSSTPLVFQVENGTSTWTMEVRENSSGGSYDLTVDAPSASETRSDVGSDELLIRPTNGTYEGTEWPILRYQDHVTGPYNLTIENKGSAASGTFRLTAKESLGDLSYDDPTGVDHSEVVYDAVLNVSLSRDELTYEGTVTAAPEGRAAR
jgi:hypothetical protein